jgi:hypothetical protein
VIQNLGFHSETLLEKIHEKCFIFKVCGQLICTHCIIFGLCHSLISMRPIYYCDTWAIIWHDIVCWFMGFS